MRGTKVNELPFLKWLLIIAGLVALGLGIVGIFVPLVPTTPLLLLAAACFVRSSNRLHHWLINHPWFGSYIRNYREHRAMTLRAKVVVLALMWGLTGYTAFVVVPNVWIQILLAIISVSVTLHLLSLKTMTGELAPLSESGRAAERS